MGKLTHLDERGNARMVDVSAKKKTARLARAEGFIRMKPETLAAISGNRVQKGNVLLTAQVAGIMAAKKTPCLIPLAHPIAITGTRLEWELSPDGVRFISTLETRDRTGIEMEALTAVTVALLTVYDMCKALDREMSLEKIGLLEKKGGRSGHFLRKAKK